MASCKQAAKTCDILVRGDSTNPCTVCEEQCVDPRTNKDILSGEPGCGAACKMCKDAKTTLTSIPVAAFDACCTLNKQCTLDGSPSIDPYGLPITSYEWEIEGNTLTGETIQYTFVYMGGMTIPLPIKRDVKLTVTNSQGASDSEERELTINNAPTAVITPFGSGCFGGGGPIVWIPPTPDPLKTYVSFCLSAAGSFDPDGDTLSYSWNCGNGQTGTGTTIICQYEYLTSVVNTFSKPVTLTATEVAGCGESDTATLTCTGSVCT